MLLLAIGYAPKSDWQIDVSVNAPEAGTIKEFLAKEEDTVSVGQDLVRLEPGESGGGGEKQAAQQPKEPAPGDQKKSSDPQEEGKPSKDEQKPPPQKEEKAPSPPPPPKEDKAPPPPKEEKTPPTPLPQPKEKMSEQHKPVESPFGQGSRGENRVCVCSSCN